MSRGAGVAALNKKVRQEYPDRSVKIDLSAVQALFNGDNYIGDSAFVYNIRQQ